MDSYVTALYDHLHLAIGKAKATAEKEAKRFKRIYDRRAGAIALHPGDKVLIRLDSFVGQRRKLKNQWGSQIHTVVRHVADGVPTYVVRNNHSGGKLVLHRARLLLWIADCTNRDDSVSVNLAIAVPMIIVLAKEGQNVNGDKGKSQVLSYGLSLAMFKTSLCPPSQNDGRGSPSDTCRSITERSWPLNCCRQGRYSSDGWRNYASGRRSHHDVNTHWERPCGICYTFGNLVMGVVAITSTRRCHYADACL